MRIGIVRLPGSNCDADTLWAFATVLGQQAEYVWHKEERFATSYDLVVIPGGFSYGDYLRAGAIARFAPVMAAVERHAAAGGAVLGICNGFQILTEAGLLPGALAANRGLRFVSRQVTLKVEQPRTPWTSGLAPGQLLRMPVAHHDGAYIADRKTLDELEDQGQVLLRYAPAGGDDGRFNPNGAENAIAGIANRAGNVFGLMPHPERAMEEGLESADGRTFLAAMLAAMEARS